ncbi:MAG: Wzz/FepE/Etk N-terminal domain-containing protein [Bacteroidota bacterium]
MTELNDSNNINTPGSATAGKLNSLLYFPFIQSLLKKWWWFLIAGIVSGIAGIYYASTQKPMYESRLTFALDAGTNEGGLSGAMNLAAQFGFGFGSGGSMFDGDNIIEILKSRRIIESVLLTKETFNGKPVTLADYYIELTELRKDLDSKPLLKNVSFPVGVQRDNFTYLQDSILNNIFLAFAVEYITADRPDKKLSIYELRVKTPNEKLSKIFTDRLIETASSFYTEITSKKDRETLEILEQRVASLKGNVGSSVDTRASSQDANVNPAFAATQTQAVKQQFNMQAYGEAYKEMFKTLEMARYQYLKKIPLLQIIDNAEYPMKKIRVGKLKTAILFSVLSVLITMLFISCYTLFRK